MENDVYEFDDDEGQGRGRGRVVAFLTVALLGAGGWFVARPALSSGSEGRGGGEGLLFDRTTTSTSTTTPTPASTTTTTPTPASTTPPSSTTTRPPSSTTTRPTSSSIATTADVVARPTTSPAPTSTVAVSSVPAQTVVATTAPSAVPFASSPDDEPAPVELQLSATQAVLTGAVPTSGDAARLVTLAEGLRLTPGPVVDELTISPSVPDTVAVRVVERNAIVFNEGSDTVQADHARQLDRFVQILDTFPDATVRITAHADPRNGVESNQAISDERARSVADYLVSQGIDVGRVSAVGVGESEPLILTASADANAVNRRVDFLFSGLLGG